MAGRRPPVAGAAIPITVPSCMTAARHDRGYETTTPPAACTDAGESLGVDPASTSGPTATRRRLSAAETRMSVRTRASDVLRGRRRPTTRAARRLRRRPAW